MPCKDINQRTTEAGRTETESSGWNRYMWFMVFMALFSGYSAWNRTEPNQHITAAKDLIMQIENGA